MYRAHFGLQEAPFSITPDPRFVFLSERHRDALAHLVYGISQGGGGGFVQLTGEVGTGKTTLSRLLLAQLPENARVALVLNPRLTPIELLETICEELGLDIESARGRGKALVDALNRYLLEAHTQDLRVVLVLDEAQQLSVDALEQVRLLTNLETASQKLLQIILLGQPELRELLARPELRQLSQRITARYHLTPLDEAETAAYVEHRLAVAGRSKCLFTPPALRALHRRSGGVPRLINVIAERCLLAGYADDAERLDADLVHRAADELSPTGTAGGPAPRRRSMAAAAAALVLTALASLWLYGQRPAPAAPDTPPRNEAVAATAATLGDLLQRSQDGAGAVGDLLAAWQADASVAGRVADCPFHLGEDLHCARGRGTLAQLAQLDRPVLLIVPDGGDVRALALLKLDGGTAWIGVGDNEPARLARADLAAAWPGEYLALMRLPQRTQAIRPGPLPAWAVQALERFELNRSLPSMSDQGGRIQRLQQSHGLRADALTGPETWWVLSTWLPGGPRLATADPTADTLGTR